MKRCETSGCCNPVIKNRKICYACKSRKYRAAHPMMAAYHLLRSNAKERGKFFDLTYEDFVEFCYETDYIQGKGKTTLSYSIDRIENDKGYTRNNIRRLSLGDNSRKGTKKLEYDWVAGQFTVTDLNAAVPVLDLDPEF